MRVLVTGGGTGGHIYPALAIARGIKEADPQAEVLFVGTSGGLEKDIVPREGFVFKTVTVEGLPRKLSLRTFMALLKTSKGCCEAFKILKDFRPSVVVGTGGYVCAPVVLTAVLMRIPTLIHEQNAYPGITNKLLAKIVRKVAVTFPESKKYFHRQADIVVTGLPIRPSILTANREKGIKVLGLGEDKFNIVVVGGSRGARSINLAMAEVISRICGREDMQVVHITGKPGYDRTVDELTGRGIEPGKCGNITLIPYLYNINDALAVADLVVCRAGATTIAEITGRGLPSILIPYPYASDNHQEYNARALVDQGAAVMILDRDLSGMRLWDTVSSMYRDKAGLAGMAEQAKKLGRPEALQCLVRIVRELAEK